MPIDPPKTLPQNVTEDQNAAIKELEKKIAQQGTDVSDLASILTEHIQGTSDTGGVITQGSAKELLAQATIAQRLEEVLSFLRTVSKTRDYFVGYSVSEVISERLEKIGPPAPRASEKDIDDKADVFREGTFRRTEMAKLNYIMEKLLGDPENPKNKGLIQDAIDLKEKLVKTETPVDQDLSSPGDPP